MDIIFNILKNDNTTKILKIVTILNDGKCILCDKNRVRGDDKFCDICEDKIKSIKSYIYKDKLSSLNIFNKKDYNNWAKKNHPDKGGDEKIFAEITKLVKNKFG